MADGKNEIMINDHWIHVLNYENYALSITQKAYQK